MSTMTTKFATESLDEPPVDVATGSVEVDQRAEQDPEEHAVTIRPRLARMIRDLFPDFESRAWDDRPGQRLVARQQ